MCLEKVQIKVNEADLTFYNYEDSERVIIQEQLHFIIYLVKSLSAVMLRIIKFLNMMSKHVVVL